jgi:formate dehydrogenase beta subunit
MTMRITIDGQPLEAAEGETILQAALRHGIYIPNLCHHPDLPPAGEQEQVDWVYRGDQAFAGTQAAGRFEGCGLCVVKVGGLGDAVRACATATQDGMVVLTEDASLQTARRERLKEILAGHPHACLTCAQRQGCTREPCSTNVPVEERCCSLWGRCELQKVSEYVGISEDTARWVPTALPVLHEPLFDRDYNLCIGCTRCVRACRELRGIDALGYVLDERGRVVVGSVAPDLKDSGCKFCTACVEVCPTGALLDRNLAGKREEALVPCRAQCPAGIDIPAYLRMIAQGDPAAAAAVVRSSAPWPNVLGTVCFHPCEEACRRGEVNEPISICALKRYAAAQEADLSEPPAPAPAEPTGKKVAVVGAGPAGLTAAYYLARKGHRVTLYEAQPAVGGMLRWGIPLYRLPEAVLNRDLDAVLQAGVEVVTGRRVGPDLPLTELQQQYEAIFLAIGAQKSRALPIPGVELEGVLMGVDFLRAVRAGDAPALSGSVLVIGGGNVAIDAALCARRLGAGQVELVSLEERDRMPAHEWECQDALAEGIIFHNGWGPQEVVGDGRAGGVHFVKCTSVFDRQGRFNPTYDESVTMFRAADWVIPAIGQEVDSSVFGGSFRRGAAGTLQVDPETLETSVPGVFAGGEAVQVPGSVVDAVAAGKRAAAVIDRFLGGDGDLSEQWIEVPSSDPHLGRHEDFAHRPRVHPPCLVPAERQGFQQIEMAYKPEAAQLEAGRCLQCDLRLHMRRVILPPEKWLEFTEENIAQVPETEGVYLLLDEEKKVFSIRGVTDLRRALEEQLAGGGRARYFEYEEDRMYTKRETELLQMHGLAGGDDDLDDLF